MSLRDILLIDNNIYSFGFQLENGIPILDFMGDRKDTELRKVMQTLHHLKGFENLPFENEKIFKLREIYNQDMDVYIRYYDSDQWSEDQIKDFDDDGHTEIQTYKDYDDFSGISEKILSPPTVTSPKNLKPVSQTNLIKLNEIESGSSGGTPSLIKKDVVVK